MKKRKYIFLGICIIMFTTFLFEGMIYLSDDGYMIWKHSLSFDAGLEEKYQYDGCYEAIVNGEHIYVIHYMEALEERNLFKPKGAYRFSVLTENIGIIEMLVFWDGENMNYEFADSTYPMIYEERLDEAHGILSVIVDFLKYYAFDNGLCFITRTVFSTGRIYVNIATMLVHIVLQLLYTVCKNKGIVKKYPLNYGGVLTVQIAMLILNMSLYITFI